MSANMNDAPQKYPDFNAAKTIARRLGITPRQAYDRGAIDERTWAGFLARQRELMNARSRREGRPERGAKATSGPTFVRSTADRLGITPKQAFDRGVVSRVDYDAYLAQAADYTRASRARRRTPTSA